jgi:hypothetical protein
MMASYTAKNGRFTSSDAFLKNACHCLMRMGSK